MSAEQHSRAEIATKEQFVGGGGFWSAPDLARTDLAERFVEVPRVRRGPCRYCLVEDPGRPLRIDAAAFDLMQEIGEI